MKTALKFGLICGFLIIAYTLATFYIVGDISKLNPQQFSSFESMGYLRYILLLFILYLAIRESRQKSVEPPSFGSLLKTGILFTLIVSFMVGFMQMAYLYFNPDFFEKYAGLYLAQMKAAGKSAEEINMAKKVMETETVMKTPWANGIFYFFLTAFIGSIAALAFSMILRPREQQ